LIPAIGHHKFFVTVKKQEALRDALDRILKLGPRGFCSFLGVKEFQRFLFKKPFGLFTSPLFPV